MTDNEINNQIERLMKNGNIFVDNSADAYAIANLVKKKDNQLLLNVREISQNCWHISIFASML